MDELGLPSPSIPSRQLGVGESTGSWPALGEMSQKARREEEKVLPQKDRRLSPGEKGEAELSAEQRRKKGEPLRLGGGCAVKWG